MHKPIMPPLKGRRHGASRDEGVCGNADFAISFGIFNPSVSYADSSPKGETLADVK